MTVQFPSWFTPLDRVRLDEALAVPPPTYWPESSRDVVVASPIHRYTDEAAKVDAVLADARVLATILERHQADQSAEERARAATDLLEQILVARAPYLPAMTWEALEQPVRTILATCSWWTAAITTRPRTAAMSRAAEIRSIAQQLQQCRKEAHWTYDELAEALGKDRKTVIRHLQGQQGLHPRTIPQYEKVFSDRLSRPVKIVP